MLVSWTEGSHFPQLRPHTTWTNEIEMVPLAQRHPASQEHQIPFVPYPANTETFRPIQTYILPIGELAHHWTDSCDPSSKLVTECLISTLGRILFAEYCQHVYGVKRLSPGKMPHSVHSVKIWSANYWRGRPGAFPSLRRCCWPSILCKVGDLIAR